MSTNALTPDEFNLSDWLDDAKRTEHSVTIYKHAHLLADIDELERQIDNAGRIPEADRTLADDTHELEAEILSLIEQFNASALVIRVQGLTADEITEIGKAANAVGETSEELGRRLLSAAIVSPKMTPADIERLNKVVGDTQVNLIVNAYQEATNNVPQVSVPFSLRSSGRTSGNQ